MRRAGVPFAVAGAVFVFALALAPVAWASSGVWWGVTSGSWPASLPAGHFGKIVLTVQNRGYETVDATEHPVVVKDVLPAGLKAIEAKGLAGRSSGNGFEGDLACKLISAGEVECRFEKTWTSSEVAKGSGHNEGEHHVLPPYQQLEVQITVQVQKGAATGEENSVSASGGGASEGVSVVREIRVGAVGEKVPFGVEQHELIAEEEGGALDRQAGSHPFQLTDVLALNASEAAANPEEQMPAAMAKELTFRLPPGLLGNPTPLPQCSESEFNYTDDTGDLDICPDDTAIGVETITYDMPGISGFTTLTVPLFNLPPLPGEPARFGFDVSAARVYLNTSVRTGSDYGVTVNVHNITQLAGFIGSKTTFWGVPGAPVHDSTRGWGCLTGRWACLPLKESDPPPFLSLPTSCTGPMSTSLQAASWVEPKPANPFEAPLFLESSMPGMLGCNHLQFSPEVSVSPDLPDASSPSGLEVKVHVPQGAVLNAEGVAEGTVRDTTVALPAGLTLNSGGANGLEACGEASVGFVGHEASEPALSLFTPTLPEPVCPNGAKIGTVEIQTPLLANPLKGSVYIATPAPQGEAEPGQNPFDSLIAMYIVAEDPVSGTLVKLAGKVVPCEATGQVVGEAACQAQGQLISTFEDTPELPFENLSLHFYGGPSAPLATPALCGSYTTNASFVPWSAEAGSSPSRSSSTFQTTSGPHGSACADPRPFTPEFQAGTTNIQAGAFSELLTTMGHPDADQVLGGLSVTMPPGLMGTLASVKLCEEPQAAQGTCGPESLIGHTTVTAGLGSTPAVVTRPGNVYITGPYKGAPFGLSIANPAETGPFDLEKGTACDCVVVRAKVEVNPLTAQLTVASDPLPTILRGVPLNLQHVQVAIDRPNFTFNPTNCDPQKITGSMTSGEGATAPVSEPFQVTNCATLAFKPTFKASTSGRTSREMGASLHVSLTYPKDAMGHDANLKDVKVELPKQLPSELKTLQHACLAAQFAVNPASCPAESVVGYAVAHTPVLPVPLEGPAYFVSYGTEWPQLIIVLQGDGVTIDLHGETHITKGITSSTFKTVPDAPVESFELTLPESEHPALAAPGGKLCQKKLVMPTSFIAQNGATLKQNTKIKVTGCAATKKKKKKAKHARKVRKGAKQGKHARANGKAVGERRS